jgi:hypothetical protein
VKNEVFLRTFKPGKSGTLSNSLCFEVFAVDA